MKEDILRFLREKCAFNGAVITESTDLFEEGLLDSFGIIALLVYLQEKYSVAFLPKDLCYENYQTVEKIVDWLEKQLK